MKKKILSLLVTGCLLFVPTTAFADDNKTVIKTVDDLLYGRLSETFSMKTAILNMVSAASSTETVILFQTLILRLFMVKICWSVSLAISRKQRYQV